MPKRESPECSPGAIPFGPLGMSDGIPSSIWEGEFDAERAAALIPIVLRDFETNELIDYVDQVIAEGQVAEQDEV